MSTENQDPAATADNLPPTIEPGNPAEQETLPPEESSSSLPSLSADDLAKLGFPSIPGYDLLEELGRGAMGVVFKAVPVELKRLVALKMILSGTQAGSAQVQRFRIEAEAAARLDHLSIVPIYEVGEHQGHHFFSMKLVEGDTLAKWITDCRPRIDNWQEKDQTDMARLLATVARAVHHAHQHGLLHRDLKPANILLQYSKNAPGNLSSATPLVADFGLAKQVEGESSLTQSGVIVGTPSYMAPEQAAGKKKLTPAADIYSLGAILYELLTGRQPFQGETVMDTLIQVMEREPPRPRALNRAIARDLETICLKAMAKDPERRYATAQELAEDLESFAAGQPIKARPAGMIELAWRRCRKHPLTAGLSAALLLVLIVVGGILLVRARGDGSLARIQSAGKIRIVVANNYPPMEFLQNGNWPALMWTWPKRWRPASVSLPIFTSPTGIGRKSPTD
jgi:serine/threonine-protein kinase